jgi:sugar O-acyltransferase (sialic acid O-acetyltransferase NeuD family)
VSAVHVVGAGGHAKVVVATLQALGREVAGIYDDDPASWGRALLGVAVVGPPERARSPAIVAIGDNRARQALVARLGLEWTSAVHPAALVHPSVGLEPGVVVFAGAVLQPDTRLGAHTVVNTAASVDHDCLLGPFVHVAPGARLAGGVAVGEGALLGIGSAVIPGVSIGAWAVVGAGAACVRAVPAGVTARGVPARW